MTSVIRYGATYEKASPIDGLRIVDTMTSTAITSCNPGRRMRSIATYGSVVPRPRPTDSATVPTTAAGRNTANIRIAPTAPAIPWPFSTSTRLPAVNHSTIASTTDSTTIGVIATRTVARSRDCSPCACCWAIR